MEVFLDGNHARLVPDSLHGRGGWPQPRFVQRMYLKFSPQAWRYAVVAVIDEAYA